MWRQVAGIALVILAQVLWLAFVDTPMIGASVALPGLILIFSSLSPDQPIPVLTFEGRFRRRRIIPLMMAAGLSFYVGWQGIQANPGSVWMLLGIWGFGISLALATFATRQQPRWPSRRELLFLGALMLIGFGLRAAWINDFPQIMAEDEGYFALQATQIRDQNWEVSPFRYGIHHHPLLFHTLQGALIDLLGQSVGAARLISAILGTLTIPGVYFAGKWMFDARIGILAALFMVTFMQHVHFSRLALNQMVDPLCAAWMMAFLARGLRTQNPFDFALAGLFLGLSQYGYSAARLLIGVAGFYLLWAWLNRRITWQAGVVTAVVALIVVWPQLYFLQSDLAPGISPRLNDVSIFEAEDVHWGKQISWAFLGFIQMEERGFFFGKYAPFLSWFAPVPFLVGVVVALRRWQNPNTPILPLWWLATVVLGGIVLTNPPEFQRFIIATPALALLIAIGVVQITQALAWLSDRITPQQPLPDIVTAWGLPIFFITALLFADVVAYVGQYRAQHPYFPSQRMYNLNGVAREVLPELDGVTIWYYPARNLNLYTSPVLRYQSPASAVDLAPVAPVDFAGFLVSQPDAHAVVIAPAHPEVDLLIATLRSIPNIVEWCPVDPLTDFLLAVVFIHNVNMEAEGCPN